MTVRFRNLTALLCTLIAWPLGCAQERFILKSDPQFLPLSKTVPAGPTARSHRVQALPAPQLKTRQLTELAAGYQQVVVAEHGRTYEKGFQRLLVKKPNGQVIWIDYTPPGGMLLPLRKNQKILIRLFLLDRSVRSIAPEEDPIQDDSEQQLIIAGRRRTGLPDLRFGGLRGWVLVIREPNNELLSMVFSGRYTKRNASEADEVGEAMTRPFSIIPSGRVVYEESLILANLCRPIIRHTSVKMVMGPAGPTIDLAPGTRGRLSNKDRHYHGLLLDASIAESAQCGPNTPDHLSFAILRAPGPKAKGATNASAGQ